MSAGSFQDLLKSAPEILTPTLRVKTAVSVVLSLGYLHSRGITHGHLKPSRILFDSQHFPRLSCTEINHLRWDRGAGSVIGNTMDEEIFIYLPPEAVEWPEPGAGKSSIEAKERFDVFSFGSFLCCLFSGLGWDPVLSNPRRESSFRKMKRLAGRLSAVSLGETPPIPKYLPLAVARMAKLCWAKDSENRPLITEIFREFVAIDFRLVEDVNTDEVEDFVRLCQEDFLCANGGPADPKLTSINSITRALSSVSVRLPAEVRDEASFRSWLRPFGKRPSRSELPSE
jgi:serine/threonine protein kinase